jgi:SAM-dependent methyltransferase
VRKSAGKRSRPPEYWDRAAPAFDAIYSGRKNRLSARLDSLLRRDMFQRYAFTLEASRPVEGRTFLDVGCGTGRYSLTLAREGAARVVGLDFSEVMIGICRGRAAAEGLTNAEFFRTDILDFDRPEKFDLSLAIGLFDYTPDPLGVLRKIRALTTGSIIASFPRAQTLRAAVRKIRLAVRGCDVYFYSREAVERLLRESGFVEIRIIRLGQLYCLTARTR